MELPSELSPGAATPPVVGGARGARIQSVDRAMLLLRAVAAADPSGMTAARLAEATGLNRATAWRILGTLAAHGVVVCSPNGRWSVGPVIVDMARSAAIDSIVNLARPVLERLSRHTEETAALAVVRHGGLTYVEEVAPTAIVAATWRGRTVPLHATSTGKVFLAFGAGLIQPLAAHERLERFTDTTLTDPDALEEQLELTRERGYAVCRGEYESSAWGVSAPVFDRDRRLVAAVSIWGPAGRVTDARLDVLGELVHTSARQLSSG